MKPAKRPDMSKDSDGASDVGEKTLVGDDFNQQTVTGPGKPAAIEANLKVSNGGTVSNVKIRKDQITTIVGNVREESDVYINDMDISPKQLAIMNLGEVFILADCGSKDKCRFNGLPIRQVIVQPGSRCIVTMGRSLLIFDTRKVADEEPKQLLFHLESDPKDHKLPAKSKFVIHRGKRNFTSSHDAMLIGAYKECDVTLKEVDKVRPFHALLYYDKDGVMIMPINSAPILVNGESIEGPTQLKHDDSFSISKEKFIFEDSGVEKVCKALFTNEAMVFDHIRFTALGDSIGPSFVVPSVGTIVTIGRSSKCHITIEDGAWSREHLQIIGNGKTSQIIDNYSANGVFVNEEKISKVRVRAGDVLEVGRSVYIIHYD